MRIYHITHLTDWEKARAAGSYRADSLASEGFIHCSTREQVPATAGRYYKGQTDLLLLEIDPEHLTAPLKYENSVGGQPPFPHIYGSLNLDAVERILPFPPNPDGSFSFPET